MQSPNGVCSVKTPENNSNECIAVGQPPPSKSDYLVIGCDRSCWIIKTAVTGELREGTQRT